MAKRPRTPVLFVHHRSELGGAPASLSYLIRELDDEQFEPHIYCPPGPAAELFRESGAHVHTGPGRGLHAHLGVDLPRPALAALRARARAAPAARPALPPDAAAQPVRARPLQRLAADPGGVARAPRGPARRLAPALGAPGRRQRRALRVRPRGDPAARDDVDRDQPRRRERLRRRLDGRPELGRPRPLPARRPRGGEGGARPARRPPGRLVLRLHLPVEGLPRVHRGRRAAARPRARRELPDRRRRRPRRGVLPHARRPLAPARRPDAELRVRGEAARRRARAHRGRPLRARSRRTRRTSTRRPTSSSRRRRGPSSGAP